MRPTHDEDTAWRRTAGPGDGDETASGPLVLDLFDPRAMDATLAGAKAANLARCAAAGLPVLPGLVVTTAATGGWGIGEPVPAAVLDELRRVLEAAGHLVAEPLVVRSSSTVEDAEESSMAGRFRSELGVTGWEGIVGALRAVRDSAGRVAGPGGSPGPIAVLLQPELAAEHGGVSFGVDPVHGDRRHLVVEVTPGNPSDLVSGRATATHIVLSRHGRRIGGRGALGGAEAMSGWGRGRAGLSRRGRRIGGRGGRGGRRDDEGLVLRRRERWELARMAARVERLFGAPQDVEWALDRRRRLWLLQSRAVTAVAEQARGPLLGPGPVAETFPAPLRRLEVDAWLVPLREGIVRALRTTGAVARRRLDRSPVALAVGGWAAVDLELLGVRRRRVRLGWSSGARRLIAAWRVGRLRAALPVLAADLVAQVDEHLADVPPLSSLDDADLVTLLANCADELVSVHGYEVLAGMLLAAEPGTTPAPALALSALARARAAGWDDVAVVADEPVVLCLTAPRFGGTDELPPAPPAPLAGTGARLGVRDSLRVRSRWLQELGGRAMAVVGGRLVAAGRLTRAEQVRELGLDELRRIVAGAPVPADVEQRAQVVAGAPLPVEFRLTPAGGVVAARRPTDRADGLGAGGGRAIGRACHRWPPGEAEPGAGAGAAAVLVVPTLDPGLATVLPSLAGLVSESGSTLSHLAILARELGVPTVVGVADARRRYPAGTRLLVDGTSGEVHPLDEAETGEGEVEE